MKKFENINPVENPEGDRRLIVIDKLAHDVICYFEGLIIYNELFNKEEEAQETKSGTVQFIISAEEPVVLTEDYLAYIRFSDSTLWQIKIVLKYKDENTYRWIENFELESLKPKNIEQQIGPAYKLSYDLNKGFTLSVNGEITTPDELSQFINKVDDIVYSEDGYNFIEEGEFYMSFMSSTNDLLERSFEFDFNTNKKLQLTNKMKQLGKFVHNIYRRLIRP